MLFIPRRQGLKKNRRSKQNHFQPEYQPPLLKFILVWVFLIGSFSLAGIILVSRAAGYKLDWQHFSIQPTGLLSLNIQPPGSQIYLNGKLVHLNHRRVIPMLPAGSYDLEIKKAGYQSWSSTIEIHPGRALIRDSIRLFLKSPKISPLQNESIQSDSFERLSDRKNIRLVDNSEVWIVASGEDKLVTRFSHPISHLAWYPDKKHLTYVYRGELRIIELNGANNMLLLRFGDQPEDETDFKYYFIDNGRRLVFSRGGEIKEAVIQ